MVGTKLVFKNKTDESRNVTSNKVKLVARLESIKFLTGMACVLDFFIVPNTDFKYVVSDSMKTIHLSECGYVCKTSGKIEEISS